MTAPKDHPAPGACVEDTTDLSTPFAQTLAFVLDEGGAGAAGVPEGSARYHTVAQIGEGGMGRVLEVIDTQFGRHVALKELLPAGRGTSLEGRFIVESMVTANLEHPGVVPIYERGRRADGTPYYTMRRVRGEPLSAAVSRARTMSDRLQLVPAIVSVAQTLAHAHERGVIHRDIKPANIFVGPRGQVFVLDWGIAKVRGLRDESGGVLPIDPAQTQAGAVVGTLSYMAPEQARGDASAIDERTDVFCLGGLLFDLLVGRAPYQGATGQEVLKKAQAGSADSIDTLAPSAPSALRDIVKRAMHPDPGGRYASAIEFADALLSLQSEALAAPPSRAVEFYSRGVEVVVFVVVTVAALAGLVAGQSFQELGWPSLVVTLFALVGLTLTFLDWRSGGRANLSAMAVALGIVTIIGAGATAVVGELRVLEVLSREEVVSDARKWREFLGRGTRESLGNVFLGAQLSMLQIVAWAVARRSIDRQRVDRDPGRRAFTSASTLAGRVGGRQGERE